MSKKKGTKSTRAWTISVHPLRLNDARVRRCSVLARLLWSHLLCSDLAKKIPGLVRAGPMTVAEHLGEGVAEVEAALGELADAGAAEVDQGARLIRLVGVAEDYAADGSGNMAIHWLRQLSEVPQVPLVGRLVEEFLADVPLPRETRGEFEQMRDRCLGRAQRALPEARSAASPKELTADPEPAESNKDAKAKTKARDTISAKELAARLDEAQRLLEKGREALGFDDEPEPITTKLKRAARRADPSVIRKLPVIVRRACERRRRELREGKDYRHLLTLTHLIRDADQYMNAAQYDVPEGTSARSPPGTGPPAPAFFEGPTTF